jgi:hypothetical protein
MTKRNCKQRRMPKDTSPALPKYAPQVMAVAQRYAHPGSLVNIAVRHDDWCDLLNRRGHCNCDPFVEGIGHHGPYGEASGRN